jgi:hypothetical protein
MDLRAEPSIKNYIAITLCDRSKFRLKNKFDDKPSFYKVSCSITRAYKHVRCDDLCPLYVGFTRFSNVCFTFLNCKYDFHPEVSKNMIIEDNKDVILLIHNYNIPPQFITTYHKIKINYSLTFEYQTIEEILLPLRYESDCHHYEQNKELFSPKSKEECILNYLKEKEYKKCKFHRNWLYEKFEFSSNETRYEPHNCSIQYNKEELNGMCKKSCKTKRYTFKIRQNSGNYWNESQIYIYNLRVHI